jgi:hypothetical protein
MDEIEERPLKYRRINLDQTLPVTWEDAFIERASRRFLLKLQYPGTAYRRAHIYRLIRLRLRHPLSEAVYSFKAVIRDFTFQSHMEVFFQQYAWDLVHDLGTVVHVECLRQYGQWRSMKIKNYFHVQTLYDMCINTITNYKK